MIKERYHKKKRTKTGKREIVSVISSKTDNGFVYIPKEIRDLACLSDKSLFSIEFQESDRNVITLRILKS